MLVWDRRSRYQLVTQWFHMLSISTAGSPVLVPHTIMYWFSSAMGFSMVRQFHLLLESYPVKKGWSSILSEQQLSAKKDLLHLNIDN